jgi:hypothetical protein
MSVIALINQIDGKIVRIAAGMGLPIIRASE